MPRWRPELAGGADLGAALRVLGLELAQEEDARDRRRRAAYLVFVDMG
jgi:hypothetical protein